MKGVYTNAHVHHESDRSRRPSCHGALTDLGTPAEEAYNATLGIRNMAGQNVTAKLESMEATIEAMGTTIKAMETSINARIDGVDVRIDALAMQIDILTWAVMATLVLVMALNAKEFLGGRKNRRSRKARKKSRSDHRPSDT